MVLHNMCIHYINTEQLQGIYNYRFAIPLSCYIMYGHSPISIPHKILNTKQIFLYQCLFNCEYNLLDLYNMFYEISIILWLVYLIIKEIWSMSSRVSNRTKLFSLSNQNKSQRKKRRAEGSPIFLCKMCLPRLISATKNYIQKRGKPTGAKGTSTVSQTSINYTFQKKNRFNIIILFFLQNIMQIFFI